MPNFHAEHSKYTGESCQLRSPMIQICRHNLAIWLSMTLAVGFIIGIVFRTYFD